MTELLRTEKLTRRYVMGETILTAVDSLDLSIEEGEFSAIAGRSGSGKSTLLALLGGLDRPTSGEIAVRGRRLAELSDDELSAFRRDSVGFVFQSFYLVPTFTAAHNVELPLALAGIPRAERRRRASDLLDRVGLAGRRNHLPSELSGGEQQRVAIARALAQDPPLLLADEPTGNLDSKTAVEILTLLKSFERKTVLLVTHDRALVGRFAHRILEMVDGRVASDERH